MTEIPEKADREEEEGALSLLPPPDMGVRVRQSQLARLLHVSRQTVSAWVKEGKLTLDANGMVNPTSAVREVISKSDPSRMKARLLKPLVNDVETLRRDLERERARADLAEINLKRSRASEGFFMALSDHLSDLMVEHESDFRQTEGADEWEELAAALYDMASEKAEAEPVDLDEAESGLIDTAKQVGQVGQWDSDEEG